MKNILYTKFFNEKIEEPINIILSPQFYWIKKIDIQLKSINEAKKIAQNLFDLNENFIFDAIKIDNNFFAIAIDKNIKINIEKKYIKSIKLAQTELYQYETINLKNNYQLKKIEDILFCFPNHTEDAPFIDDILENIKLSKTNINLFNFLEIDKTIIILLTIIFIFLTTSLSSLIYSYKQQEQNLILEKNRLKSFKLPLTNLQLNSISSELEELKFQNTLLKKNLKFITKTPLQKGDKFLELSKNLDTYLVKIKTKKNLNNYFKQRFNIKSFSFKNSIYKAELTNG